MLFTHAVSVVYMKALLVYCLLTVGPPPTLMAL